MTREPLLLIGGTRSTGLLAVRILQQRGIPIRILARNPAVVRNAVSADVEIIPGDVTKRDTLIPALVGISHLDRPRSVPPEQRWASARHSRTARVRRHSGCLSVLLAPTCL